MVMVQPVISTGDIVSVSVGRLKFCLNVESVDPKYRLGIVRLTIPVNGRLLVTVISKFPFDITASSTNVSDGSRVILLLSAIDCADTTALAWVTWNSRAVRPTVNVELISAVVTATC